jgi:hypothetical protein
MHDLITLNPAPGSLTVAEIDATMAYAEAEKAASTRRAYESDWHDFTAWCAARGASVLPAHVGHVAAYFSRNPAVRLPRSGGGQPRSGIATNWRDTHRPHRLRAGRRLGCAASAAPRSATLVSASRTFAVGAAAAMRA